MTYPSLPAADLSEVDAKQEPLPVYLGVLAEVGPIPAFDVPVEDVPSFMAEVEALAQESADAIVVPEGPLAGEEEASQPRPEPPTQNPTPEEEWAFSELLRISDELGLYDPPQIELTTAEAIAALADERGEYDYIPMGDREEGDDE